jgi:hypothetical protein
MKAIITWIKDNKVFFLGLLGAIAVALQQFIGTPTIDWLTVGYAVGIAGLSYIANQWRGQGMTILGIIGTLAWTFVETWQGGKIDWKQLIIMSVVAILTAVSPSAKPKTYEKPTEKTADK